MNKELSELLERIKTNRDLLTANEAQTSQGIVLPLLNKLGWNVFDTSEVSPEFKIGNMRVDFALRLNQQNKVFLEIKKTSENLDNHQEQLVYYAFQQGVKLAILTNGITWQFYLPLEEGSWEQRRFFTIDLLAQADTDSGRRFDELLLKESIENGTAYNNARTLYEGRQKNKVIKETLPAAWKKLIDEPDGMLVELLNETLEKISGYKADDATVVEFLRKHTNSANTFGQQTMSAPSASTPRSPRIRPSIEVPLEKDSDVVVIDPDSPDDILHTRVTKARLNRVELPRNWRNALHQGMLIALGKGHDIPSLNNVLRVNFKKGQHTEHGFGPIEGTNYSWQNQDANKTLANIIRLARFLKAELEVEFEWREKGKFPGKKGVVRTNP